jgi:hypothetical protein
LGNDDLSWHFLLLRSKSILAGAQSHQPDFPAEIASESIQDKAGLPLEPIQSYINLRSRQPKN